MNQDFGILFHEGAERQSIIEAILTDTLLTFNFIDLDSYHKIRYRDLLVKLDLLSNLNYEETYREPGICIKRWNPKCIEAESQWISELKELFPEPYTGEAYHCVCFKNQKKNNPESTIDEDIREILLQTKYDLEKNSKELGIQSIWFGRRSEDSKEVFDPKFKGKIKISNDYNYLFLTKFNSQEEMEKYYEKEVHGIIRSELYKKLDGGLKFLCERYADNMQVRTADKVTVFEEIIEEIVSKYMIRHDFSNIENIETIVYQDNRIPFNYQAIER